MGKINGMHYVHPDDERIQPKKATREPENDLDKNAFMKLLVTQLRYQDPLEPMDNQAFMAQMAQFSALEHMMNMSASLDRSSAHALIGKVVEATYTDPVSKQLESIAGKVDSVITRNGNHFLSVNGKEVTLQDVGSVIDPSLISNTEINSGFELIGKTVQATIFNKETQQEFLYEGQVEKIAMKNSQPNVVIGRGDHGVTIPVDNVKNIIETPTITGKYAQATIVDQGGNLSTIEGRVDYLLVIDGEIQVSINNKMIPFDQIETVSKQ